MANKLFYTYIHNSEGKENKSFIPEKAAIAYWNSLVFDVNHRTIWHQGMPFGNVFPGTYSYGEVFNDIDKNQAWGEYSHAEGKNNHAVGYASHAEGINVQVNASSSHAEGLNTYIDELAETSHVEGRENMAYGIYAHIEGLRNVSYSEGSHIEGSDNKVEHYSEYSHAEGIFTKITGRYSHTEGNNTTVTTEGGHAEGNSTNVTGQYGHAEGYKSVTKGQYGHAEGETTNAEGKASHAEGNNTFATDYSAHAEGISTCSYKTAAHTEGYFNVTNSAYAHTEGGNNTNNGITSHVEGSYNINNSTYSHTEGTYSYIDKDSLASHSEGYKNASYTAKYSHIEGSNNVTYGQSSHIEGNSNSTKGQYSHVEGYHNIATGKAEHIEGAENKSENNNEYTHIEGYGNSTKSNCTHIEGSGNTIDEKSTYSHIGGYNSSITCSSDEASANISTFVHGYNIVASNSNYGFAVGLDTRIKNEGEATLGKYNRSIASSKGNMEGQTPVTGTIFTIGVGNGEDDYFDGATSYRWNAFQVMEDGVTYSYESYCYNIITDAPNYFEPGFYPIATTAYVMMNSVGKPNLQPYPGTDNYPIHAEYFNLYSNNDDPEQKDWVNMAYGDYSHAEGKRTYVYPTSTGGHAEGIFTETYNVGEHASGKYNKASDTTLFTVGNGSNEDFRHNLFSIEEGNTTGIAFVNDLPIVCSVPTDTDPIYQKASYIWKGTSEYYQKICNNEVDTKLDNNTIYFVKDGDGESRNDLITRADIEELWNSFLEQLDTKLQGYIKKPELRESRSNSGDTAHDNKVDALIKSHVSSATYLWTGTLEEFNSLGLKSGQADDVVFVIRNN